MSVARGRMPVIGPVEILAFEARWSRHSPEKSEAVRRALGISITRHYQLRMPCGVVTGRHPRASDHLRASFAIAAPDAASPGPVRGLDVDV